VNVITTNECKAAGEAYKQEAARKSDLARTDLSKDKTGQFTGAYAINPVNGTKIPIWISDYVLISYGTGAIMAVPAHDERDFAFATKFKLPIIQVVEPDNAEEAKLCKEGKLCFAGDGTAINSGTFSGLRTPEFKEKITAWLEAEGLGKKAVNYKLRDWLFSRQRYWGEPFPILHKLTGRLLRWMKANCRWGCRSWRITSRPRRASRRWRRRRLGARNAARGTKAGGRPIRCRNGREVAGTICGIWTDER
jgi:leucyl-tRNA synthetase